MTKALNDTSSHDLALAATQQFRARMRACVSREIVAQPYSLSWRYLPLGPREQRCRSTRTTTIIRRRGRPQACSFQFTDTGTRQGRRTMITRSRLSCSHGPRL